MRTEAVTSPGAPQRLLVLSIVQTHCLARRNTARKFLAASNFLELLHIFDSDKGAIDIPSIDEKIKYAKWKAADISKALREGRKPTAGPVGSAADETLVAAADLPDLNMVPPPITPPSASFPLPSKQSSPSIRPTSPPQLTNLSQADHHQLGAHLPDGLAPPLPPQSPGNWSTIATPGTPGFHLQDGINYASLPGGVPPGSGGRTRKAYVSGELEGKSEEDIDAEITPPASAERSVHFSPSVVGGLETPGLGGPEEDPFSVQVVVNPSIQPQPSAPPFEGHPAYSSAPEYPYAAGPQPSSQSVPSAWPVRPPPPTMPSPSASNTHPPPVTSPASDIATSTITITPAELTPQVVSRVQKHCKYAISALDYEDAEQAIKELRTALRMLGG